MRAAAVALLLAVSACGGGWWVEPGPLVTAVPNARVRSGSQPVRVRLVSGAELQLIRVYVDGDSLFGTTVAPDFRETRHSVPVSDVRDVSTYLGPRGASKGDVARYIYLFVAVNVALTSALIITFHL